MTNAPQVPLKPPSLTSLLSEITRHVAELPGMASAEELHGKFRIEDLDRISFRTPAAFVSAVMSDLTPQHAGALRLNCQFAVMLVTRVIDRRVSSQERGPHDLAIDVVRLVHRNTFGHSKTGQPEKFQIIPILTSAERTRAHALTAVTWKQEMTVLEGPMRARDVHRVENPRGEAIYERPDTSQSSG